jgi:hypothetical protein
LYSKCGAILACFGKESVVLNWWTAVHGRNFDMFV